eukprot:5230439-Amphidinium_carterae.1
MEELLQRSSPTGAHNKADPRPSGTVYEGGASADISSKLYIRMVVVVEKLGTKKDKRERRRTAGEPCGHRVS